jgi:hypothetical protein
MQMFKKTSCSGPASICIGSSHSASACASYSVLLLLFLLLLLLLFQGANNLLVVDDVYSILSDRSILCLPTNTVLFVVEDRGDAIYDISTHLRDVRAHYYKHKLDFDFYADVSIRRGCCCLECRLQGFPSCCQSPPAMFFVNSAVVPGYVTVRMCLLPSLAAVAQEMR